MDIRELCTKNNHYATDGFGTINTRCPFCGDSQKINHRVGYGQLYIYADGYSKCFRCGKYATAIEAIEEIFATLNIPPDHDLLSKFKTKEIQYIYSNNSYKYIKTSQDEFNYYPEKIKYLENRLLTKIDVDYINKNKFVLDISKYDDIISTKVKYPINYDMYVGYITAHNKKIILRSLVDTRFKHIKIDLINDLNAIDYWSNNDLVSEVLKSRTLILSEGIFDCNNSRIREIFGDYPVAASLSKLNLINTIKYIYSETIVKFDLILLKDLDISKSFIRFFIKQVKPYLKSITIYSNLNGKDFGELDILVPNVEMRLVF